MAFSDRTRVLLGKAAVERLAACRVLIFGIGGVGGAAAEMLCRAGVGALTLADGDRVEASNLNRQLFSLTSEIGERKTDAAARRLLAINPDLKLTLIPRRIAPDEAASLLDAGFDGAIDAIDDVPVKVAFLAAAYRRGVPVVSSMGAGGKLDPALVRCVDISRTEQDPLARAVRRRLREQGIARGIEVVGSTEPPREAAEPEAGAIGTISYMPNLFGCHCAAALLRRLLDPRDFPKPEEGIRS